MITEQKYLNDFEKKKQFLLRHKNFFLAGVSFWFQLTHEQLRKYQTILVWSEIANNFEIQWTKEIIEEFNEYLFLDPDSDINTNEKLPWSIALVEKYETKWNWELLSHNHAAISVPGMLNNFYRYLYPYLDLDDKNNQLNFITKEEAEINLLESEFADIDLYPELQLRSILDIEKEKNIDWSRLSQNTFLPWSAELIEFYKNDWDWEWLNSNESIPWDIKLLKQFEDKIEWAKVAINEDGTTYISPGISTNTGLEWDTEILTNYLSRLSGHHVSMCSSAKWEIDFLIQFENFWDYDILKYNPQIMPKVFSEFQAEGILSSMLDILLDKENELNISKH